MSSTLVNAGSKPQLNAQRVRDNALTEQPLRAFVFLAHGFGATDWTDRWNRGRIPGLNEKLPYGYYHAANDRCVVQYSEDARENRLTQLTRRLLRRLLGCDLVHAYRNRQALCAADVVWTHTELEYLAVLALWQLRPIPRRPKLIAQSVWLFDRWPHFSRPRRWFYRRLMHHADVLTVLCPDSLRAAHEMFPDVRIELVRFGADLDVMVPPVQRSAHRPVRIVSLGSDMHRDWQTLLSLAEQWPGCTIRIASSKLDPRLAARTPNVEIVAASSRREVIDLFSWADITVVSTDANIHASGITVACEGTLLGLPLICTDTEGLRYYFSEDDVRFVPPRDLDSLRRAIDELAGDDRLRVEMATRAQARMVSTEMSSRSYARHHYDLSRQLLSRQASGNQQRASARHGV